MILRELASRLGCTLRGDGDVEVVRVAGIDEAVAGDLTFVANPKYASRLATTRASAVIVAPDLETALPSLVCPNPYYAYARAVAVLHPPTPPPPGIHPQAVVDPSAHLAPGVHVGPFAVVGARVRIGPRSVLHPHVVVYPDVQIGADCLVHSSVQIREGCRLGDRVVVQNGAIIGADGFGFAKGEDGRYQKIPQLGIVVVEDDVEIGALVAVDRSSLHVTRIGRGTKIDNMVQIGHSVTIGSDTVLAGQVGVAGSTHIGDRVTLAGQVGVAGHLTIGNDVIATAQTGIPHSVEAGAVISGYPAIENRAWLKSSAVFAKLPQLQRRVRELERRLAALGHPAEGED